MHGVSVGNRMACNFELTPVLFPLCLRFKGGDYATLKKDWILTALTGSLEASGIRNKCELNRAQTICGNGILDFVFASILPDQIKL
jgi:hypothetical protein